MESFVNRETALKHIDDAFITLQDKKRLLQTPIMDFYGVKRIGKTLFLKKVQQCCQNEQVTVYGLMTARVFPDAYTFLGIQNDCLMSCHPLERATDIPYVLPTSASYSLRGAEPVFMLYEPFGPNGKDRLSHEEKTERIGIKAYYTHSEQTVLYQRAEGCPILISLVAEILNKHIRLLRHLVVTPLNNIEPHLTMRINNLKHLLNRTILFMAHTYHRFNSVRGPPRAEVFKEVLVLRNESNKLNAPKKADRRRSFTVFLRGVAALTQSSQAIAHESISIVIGRVKRPGKPPEMLASRGSGSREKLKNAKALPWSFDMVSNH